jgi:hypothetical protein
MPAFGVVAGAQLFHRAAPRVTELIFEALKEPLRTKTSHACFDGHEVYCFLPPFPTMPPLENRTMRPRPGEMVFFHAAPNEFACLADDRLTGGAESVHELAFMYGEVDLRHYWEEGFHGSLVGSVDTGLVEFAEACRRTLDEGRSELIVSREGI